MSDCFFIFFNASLLLFLGESDGTSFICVSIISFIKRLLYASNIFNCSCVSGLNSFVSPKFSISPTVNGLSL